MRQHDSWQWSSATTVAVKDDQVRYVSCFARGDRVRVTSLAVQATLPTLVCACRTKGAPLESSSRKYFLPFRL